MAEMRDSELVQQISTGASSREKALLKLYNDKDLNLTIKNFVFQNGGTQEEAKDIFQDAIIIFDSNVRNGRYRNEGSLRAYLFGIAKYTWQNTRRKKKCFIPIDNMDFQGTEQLDIPLVESRIELMEKSINELGEKCKRILLFVLKSYSMSEIANIMSYRNSDVVKKEAYLCRKRLKEYMLNLMKKDGGH